MFKTASYWYLLLRWEHCSIQLLWVFPGWCSVYISVCQRCYRNFDSDWERLYPRFNDSVSGDDIIFKNLNRKCSVILGFEVLAHLNGANTPASLFSKICEFTEKERNIIKNRWTCNEDHVLSLKKVYRAP